MGQTAQRLNTLIVKTVSTDGKIQLRLRHCVHVDLAFREGAYRRYTELELAEQLAGTAEGLALICRDAVGSGPDGGPSHEVALRRYQAARDLLTAAGGSANERVRIRTRGLRDWHVHIVPGSVAALDEVQFKAHVYVAVGRLWLDYRRGLAELRQRFRFAPESALELTM